MEISITRTSSVPFTVQRSNAQLDFEKRRLILSQQADKKDLVVLSPLEKLIKKGKPNKHRPQHVQASVKVAQKKQRRQLVSGLKNSGSVLKSTIRRTSGRNFELAQNVHKDMCYTENSMHLSLHDVKGCFVQCPRKRKLAASIVKDRSLKMQGRRCQKLQTRPQETPPKITNSKIQNVTCSRSRENLTASPKYHKTTRRGNIKFTDCIPSKFFKEATQHKSGLKRITNNPENFPDECMNPTITETNRVALLKLLAQQLVSRLDAAQTLPRSLSSLLYDKNSQTLEHEKQIDQQSSALLIKKKLERFGTKLRTLEKALNGSSSQLTGTRNDRYSLPINLKLNRNYENETIKQRGHLHQNNDSTVGDIRQKQELLKDPMHIDSLLRKEMEDFHGNVSALKINASKFEKEYSENFTGNVKESFPWKCTKLSSEERRDICPLLANVKTDLVLNPQNSSLNCFVNNIETEQGVQTVESVQIKLPLTFIKSQFERMKRSKADDLHERPKKLRKEECSSPLKGGKLSATDLHGEHCLSKDYVHIPSIEIYSRNEGTIDLERTFQSEENKDKEKYHENENKISNSHIQILDSPLSTEIMLSARSGGIPTTPCALHGNDAFLHGMQNSNTTAPWDAEQIHTAKADSCTFLPCGKTSFNKTESFESGYAPEDDSDAGKTEHKESIPTSWYSETSELPSRVRPQIFGCVPKLLKSSFLNKKASLIAGQRGLFQIHGILEARTVLPGSRKKRPRAKSSKKDWLESRQNNLECIKKDFRRQKKEVHWQHLKWDQQVLKEELQRLDAEINETKARMACNPFLAHPDLRREPVVLSLASSIPEYDQNILSTSFKKTEGPRQEAVATDLNPKNGGMDAPRGPAEIHSRSQASERESRTSCFDRAYQPEQDGRSKMHREQPEAEDETGPSGVRSQQEYLIPENLAGHETRLTTIVHSSQCIKAEPFMGTSDVEILTNLPVSSIVQAVQKMQAVKEVQENNNCISTCLHEESSRRRISSNHQTKKVELTGAKFNTLQDALCIPLEHVNETVSEEDDLGLLEVDEELRIQSSEPECDDVSKELMSLKPANASQEKYMQTFFNKGFIY